MQYIPYPVFKIYISHNQKFQIKMTHKYVTDEFIIKQSKIHSIIQFLFYIDNLLIVNLTLECTKLHIKYTL